MAYQWQLLNIPLMGHISRGGYILGVWGSGGPHEGGSGALGAPRQAMAAYQSRTMQARTTAPHARLVAELVWKYGLR